MSQNFESTPEPSPVRPDWSESEVELLIRLICEGKSLDDLCHTLRRDPAAVYLELSYLAVRRPREWLAPPPRPD